MIHAHNLTAGHLAIDPADSAYRRLAAAVLLRAVQDARGTHLYYRRRALWWLQQPEAQGMADILDLALPDVRRVAKLQGGKVAK